MVFYGTKNGIDYGFYLDNEGFINDKYVEVDDGDHITIINRANNEQLQIVPDENGYPKLVAPPPPSEDELKEREINELQQYLLSTDWYAIRYADTGEPIPNNIKEKRADARKRISELRN